MVAVVAVISEGEGAAFSCVILPCIVLHSVTYKDPTSPLYTIKMKPASTGGTTANSQNSKFLFYIFRKHAAPDSSHCFFHKRKSGEPRAICCQYQLCVPTIAPLQPSVVSTCRNQKSKEDVRVYVGCKQTMTNALYIVLLRCIAVPCITLCYLEWFDFAAVYQQNQAREYRRKCGQSPNPSCCCILGTCRPWLFAPVFISSIPTLYPSKMKPASTGGTTANFLLPSSCYFFIYSRNLPLLALRTVFPTENIPASREQCAASASFAYQQSPPYPLASYRLIEIMNPRETSEYTLTANNAYPGKQQL